MTGLEQETPMLPKAGTNPALAVRGLRVEFDGGEAGPLVAVRDVSIDVAPGELLGLVGESGCGKSTTLLAIVGLVASSATISGSVRLEGQELFTPSQKALLQSRGVGIGLVLQASMSSLNPVKNVLSQIAEPLIYHGVLGSSAARIRARELLALMQLPAHVGSLFPHELSGGMRQRASIAVALATDPKVLLLDEPTTALDVIAQARVLELVRTVAREQRVAVVLVTHDLPLVAQYCDEVAVMYAGEVVERRRTTNWDDEPRHPYTRLLLASTPDLFDSQVPATIPGTPPRLDQIAAGCAFRDRCDSALTICETERPLLRSVGATQRVACHAVSETESDR
jgi:oligopeptide/dipeptide ABC transporter ATP-binding protein